MTTQSNPEDLEHLAITYNEKHRVYIAHDITGRTIAWEPDLGRLVEVCQEKGYTKTPTEFSTVFIDRVYYWLSRYQPVRSFIADLWKGDVIAPREPIGFRRHETPPAT